MQPRGASNTCLNMYIYIYIYIHMCMYTHIYIMCIHTYIHTHINTHTRICMSVSTGGVERAFSICQAQPSVRFPQIDWSHFLLEFVISPKYSGTQIIADIPIHIDWHLKIQNTDFAYLKFPPPILSPLHSTRRYMYTSINTRIYIYVCVCMCMCINVYTRIYI